MHFEQLSLIRRDVNEFLSKNHKKYEIISKLQDYLINLTNETYQETIQFISNHLDIFFKDHSSSLFFFF